MPTIPAATLKEFALELLVAGGVGREEAGLVADSLVGANLRGHDSHGVMRIPYYLDTVAKGEVVPGAEFKVMKESPTLLVADGGWGFGQTQARRLMDGLIAKAKQSGAGIGTLIHCGHIGRLGEYCEQAAAAGLVSMIMVNTHGHMRRVAPVGGKAPRLGTNPWPSACRTRWRRWCSTSAPAPRPKARCGVKHIAGQVCPDGWLLDSEGRPTNDPNSLYGNPPGTILPMGGTQAYKGFGLGLMVEIFAGALVGRRDDSREADQSERQLRLHAGPRSRTHGRRRSLRRRSLAIGRRSCVVARAIEGVDSIQLPGDPEQRTLAERSEKGIPLDDGNWGQLAALAGKLGVSAPA